MKPRDFFVIPAMAIGVMALNVAIAFALVWVYSLFEPGHPDAHYEAVAMRWAPISSVVAGIPLMFMAGFLIAKRRSERSALLAAGAVAGVYIAIDGAVLLAADAGQEIWGWAALSFATKFVSALAGAKLRAGRSRGELSRQIAGDLVHFHQGSRAGE